jgi:hypothetical protein
VNPQVSNHNLSAETIAIIIVFLVTIARTYYEIQVTFNVMGISMGSIHPQEWQRIVISLLVRPIFYLNMLFSTPIVYIPVYLIFRSNSLLSAKTSDLTKGSIAQNELEK